MFYDEQISYLSEKYDGGRNRRKIGSTFVIKNMKKLVSFTTKTQTETLGLTNISAKRRIQRVSSLIKDLTTEGKKYFSGNATRKIIHMQVRSILQKTDLKTAI